MRTFHRIQPNSGRNSHFCRLLCWQPDGAIEKSSGIALTVWKFGATGFSAWPIMIKCLQIILWMTIVGLAPLRGVASAGQSYAFLVGVSDYDEKELNRLPFARADILAFRNVLIQSGFPAENIVTMVDDLTALPKSTPAGRFLPEREKIQKELSILLPSLDVDDTVIIALAGHGVQFKGDNEPYFCPANAQLADRNTLISLSSLYDQLKYDAQTMQGCKARQRLLIVDACRNDPRTHIARSAGSPELESVSRPQMASLPEGVVALFSCAEGQQALEHPPLKHGIFFYHVLEAWQGRADDGDRQLTLDEMIAFTKSKTQNYARTNLGAAQTPRQKGYFDGTWVLRSLPPVHVSKSTGMQFAYIPAGEFMMGRPSSAPGDNSEIPQHRVRLTRPFYLGIYEVTQAQYELVMGNNPSQFRDVAGQDTRQFPVERVSWYDAIEFCNKLSQLDGLQPKFAIQDIQRTEGSITSARISLVKGKGYKVPREAEWEYACRGTSTTAFHFGSELNGEQANVNGTVPRGTTKSGPFLERPTAVGSYLDSRNSFGLFDMHGNVWEWCADIYDEKAYQNRQGTSIDPVVITGHVNRVIRGGSWNRPATFARTANRFSMPPTNQEPTVGFRVLLTSED